MSKNEIGFHDVFVEVVLGAAKDTENRILNNVDTDLLISNPTGTAMGLFGIGVSLHEKLIEMSIDPQVQSDIVSSSVGMFQTLATRRLTLDEEQEKQSDNYQYAPSGLAVDQVIRRTAICYGLVSGLTMAASNKIRDDNDRQN